MRDTIEEYWSSLAMVAGEMPISSVARAADVLLDCRRRGGTVFLLGNGGSAATASHFACDLAKGTRNGDSAFRVMALTDNMALLTAWANDTSYDRVFAEQLSALVHSGDVVILISTSGNSRNILAAAEVAREVGAHTVAMTGRNGGTLATSADVTIAVPSDSIELVEDAHLAICHSISVALRGTVLHSLRLPSGATASSTEELPNSNGAAKLESPLVAME